MNTDNKFMSSMITDDVKKLTFLGVKVIDMTKNDLLVCISQLYKEKLSLEKNLLDVEKSYMELM